MPFLSLEKNVETYAWPSGFTVLRLVNALCCAGLPAQLLKEVVLEAIDMAIITSSLVNSVVYSTFQKWQPVKKAKGEVGMNFLVCSFTRLGCNFELLRFHWDQAVLECCHVV